MTENLLIRSSRLIRLIGMAEGISYLVLMFVAMPLKYMAGIPEPVKYFGWMHGLLFIAFCAAILLGRLRLKWSLPYMFFAFILSLLPFGTFWLDRKMKVEEEGLKLQMVEVASDDRLSV